MRFAVAYIQGNGSGHVQSLILGAVLFNAGVVVAALGVIGDLLSAQRTMIQRTTNASGGSSCNWASSRRTTRR